MGVWAQPGTDIDPRSVLCTPAGPCDVLYGEYPYVRSPDELNTAQYVIVMPEPEFIQMPEVVLGTAGVHTPHPSMSVNQVPDDVQIPYPATLPDVQMTGDADVTVPQCAEFVTVETQVDASVPSAAAAASEDGSPSPISARQINNSSTPMSITPCADRDADDAAPSPLYSDITAFSPLQINNSSTPVPTTPHVGNDAAAPSPLYSDITAFSPLQINNSSTPVPTTPHVGNDAAAPSPLYSDISAFSPLPSDDGNTPVQDEPGPSAVMKWIPVGCATGQGSSDAPVHDDVRRSDANAEHFDVSAAQDVPGEDDDHTSSDVWLPVLNDTADSNDAPNNDGAQGQNDSVISPSVISSQHQQQEFSLFPELNNVRCESPVFQEPPSSSVKHLQAPPSDGPSSPQDSWMSDDKPIPDDRQMDLKLDQILFDWAPTRGDVHAQEQDLDFQLDQVLMGVSHTQTKVVVQPVATVRDFTFAACSENPTRNPVNHSSNEALNATDIPVDSIVIKQEKLPPAKFPKHKFGESPMGDDECMLMYVHEKPFQDAPDSPVVHPKKKRCTTSRHRRYKNHHDAAKSTKFIDGRQTDEFKQEKLSPDRSGPKFPKLKLGESPAGDHECMLMYVHEKPSQDTPESASETSLVSPPRKKKNHAKRHRRDKNALDTGRRQNTRENQKLSQFVVGYHQKAHYAEKSGRRRSHESHRDEKADQSTNRRLRRRQHSAHDAEKYAQSSNKRRAEDNTATAKRKEVSF